MGSAKTTFVEYLYPDGCIGMVFDFGDPFRFDSDSQSIGCFLDGTTTRVQRLRLGGDIHAVGVRFKPGRAFPFFPVALTELENQITPLGDLGMRNLESLYDRMWRADSSREKLGHLDGWLRERLWLSQGTGCHAAVDYAIKVLQRTNGNSAIQSVADTAGIGRRQLERLFKHRVGVSPKKLAQVFRVESARNALRYGLAETCINVGCDAGYYDQAHFIREFTEITGITPGAYKLLKRTVGGELDLEM